MFHVAISCQLVLLQSFYSFQFFFFLDKSPGKTLFFSNSNTCLHWTKFWKNHEKIEKNTKKLENWHKIG